MQSAPFVTSYLTEHCADDAFQSYDGYAARGGYGSARAALSERKPEDVVELVKSSGLQGRGGAGFSTGLKWSFMPPGSEYPKYLVCNADESEPGSFKDRLLIERAPHQLLEGILIAAFATGAEKTFVYIRGEYEAPARVLQAAIDEAYARGALGADVLGTGFRHDVVLQRGAGAYICGEETGLLESLEGKKGQPRKKPPFPAQHGAFGMPTTVNNVETFSHVPHILRHGAEWFRGFGSEKSPGTTIFGVSGHVVQPGLYELPLGTPLDEIVFEHAGGVPNGKRVKGVIPGGMSMPILPADQLDVPMANEFLRERKTMLGTGGDHGDGREHLHGARRLRHHLLLPRRVLRPVHPVPRGHRLAPQDHPAHRARRRSRGRSRDPRGRGGEDGGADHLRVRRRRSLARPGPAAPLPERLRAPPAREDVPVRAVLRVVGR